MHKTYSHVGLIPSYKRKNRNKEARNQHYQDCVVEGQTGPFHLKTSSDQTINSFILNSLTLVSMIAYNALPNGRLANPVCHPLLGKR